MTLRSQVVLAVFRRNFASYFSGVLGYLFILVFVVAGAAMAFNAEFFTANVPTLDQLTGHFPLLLLFLVPAITMTVWADEKKQGTDELLFTLPVTDVEVLLGKYLSVVAVYTVTLLFSLAYVVVLKFLGNPDWGLLFTTYLGYWIAGSAMLSAGMLASVLTRTPTVAYILGAVMAGIPVFMGYVGRLIEIAVNFVSPADSGSAGAMSGTNRLLADLSLQEQLRDFGLGVIPLSGVIYFVAFTVLMLYLNLVFIAKRHWAAGQSVNNGMHYTVRAVCLAVILTCGTVWAGYTAFRVDATAEQLFSLSPATRTVLNEIEADRPIEIQAFLSPDVPAEYVDTRRNLVGLLRQFDQIGGGNVTVRYVDVGEFSKEAEEAEHFGIEPVRLVSEVDGRRTEVEVYLGAVVISSYDKVVVPFFGKGLPIEYELTRSIRTVATDSRPTVGILTTDANLLNFSQEWQIVTELKKQYDVESVSPSAEIDPEQFDVLMAVMPSSLTDPEMDNLVSYVKAGHPTLIFDDPFPIALASGMGINNAPKLPKPQQNPMGGMFGGQQPPPPAKADGGRATRLMNALDIKWAYDEVVFDVNNPHPQYGSLPQEYLFTTRDGHPHAFSGDSSVSSGLQEVLSIYSGYVQERNSEGRDTQFVELMKTSGSSGRLMWDEFTQQSFDMFSRSATVVPRPADQMLGLRRTDQYSYVLAAHITSDKEGDERNAIFVADIDMISDFFFRSRVSGDLDLSLDNVTFVLNAVDTLAGDETYISLRSRRAEHRTLARLERQKNEFLEEARKREADADSAADDELKARQETLQARLKEIQDDENLDPVAKSQMIRQAEEAESTRLSLAEAQIEQKKNREIRKIQADTNRKTRAVELQTQLAAIFLSPLPAIFLGLLVLGKRLNDEKRNVVESRRRT